MADDVTTTTDPTVDLNLKGEIAPPPDTIPPPVPTPEELLVKEREDRIRAEARAAALDEQIKRPAPAASPPPPPPLTPDVVEAAFSKGEITDAHRVQLLARIEADRLYQERAVADRRRQTEQRAVGRMNELLTQHPDLRDSKSEMIRKVSAELNDLAEMGYDPQDLRTQIHAVERVVGGHKAGGTSMTDGKEFGRRRIPVGGAPTTTPEAPKTKEPSKGERIFERLTPEARDFYLAQRGDRAAAVKTLEYADESMLARQGRFAK